MKITLLMIICMLSIFSLHGQGFDYEKAWDKVERWQKERKPESALKVIAEITEAAERDDNYPQLLKAWSYQSEFIRQDEDHGSTRHLTFLDQKTDVLPSPANQIVHLIAYWNYWNYYQNQRYIIRDRTTIYTDAPDDINEWTTKNFTDHMRQHLVAAINDPKTLLVPVEDYQVILNEFNDAGKLRKPYLLDVVFSYVIDQLKNPSITLAEFGSVNWTEELVTSVDSFVKLDLSGETGYHEILQMYQQILSIHLAQEEDMATLHADLARLSFVKGLVSNEKGDRWYSQGLQNAMDYYQHADQVHQINYTKAIYLYSTHQQEGKQNRKLEAYRILEEIPDSVECYQQSRNLMQLITQKKYEAKVKQVYSSDECVEVEINTTNLEVIDYEVVSIPFDFIYNNRRRSDELKAYLEKQTVITKGSQKLAKDTAFLESVSKLTLPNPGYGHYALVLKSGDGYYYTDFTISDLAYATYENGPIHFLVMDRILGKPYHQVKIEVYNQFYNRQTRTSQRERIGVLSTNKEGEAIYRGTSDKSVSVQMVKGKDRIVLRDQFYSYDHPRRDNDRGGEIFILADRAIYRPGQTLHFKGLLLDYQNNIPTVGHSENVEVTLRDANYSVVKEMTIPVNDFGSASSSLVLPIGGLTGSFILEMSAQGYSGAMSFRVEEYRRPKFEVSLEKPQDSYQIGDTVTITGNAVSFASVPVSETMVKYRVYRSERTWWWYYRPGGDERVLLSKGETKTDEMGAFGFNFVALGEVDKTYVYTIETDVTDLSGETQSGETSLAISAKPFFISMDIPKIKDVSDSDLTYMYNIQNSAGESIKQISKYTITALLDPGKLLPTQDNGYRPMSGGIASILKLWKEEEVIRENEIADQERKIDLDGLPAGGYKIRIIAGGEEFVQYFALTDRKKKKYPFVQPVFAHFDKDKYMPGEEVNITLGTPFKEIYLRKIVERRSGQKAEEWIKIKRQKREKIKVKEADYGGLGFTWLSVKDNQYYTKSHVIQVPWDHKKLAVSYLAMRDQLVPGSKEKWKIRISGTDQDEILAEVCASLYDMSLDQFVDHRWARSFYPGFNSRVYWRGRGFTDNSGRHLVGGWNAMVNKRTEPVVYPRFQFLDYHSNVMLRARSKMNAIPESAMSVSQVVSEKADGMLDELVVMDTELQETSTKIESPSPSIDVTNPVRTNLQETVFFYPQLYTDQDGNLEIEFTMGEALTKWKFQLFAHNKSLQYVFDEKEIVTKKELMVFPYPPRFLRQGDSISITGKVSNLSDKALNSKVRLQLFNALTEEEVTSNWIQHDPIKIITLDPYESKGISYQIRVPESFTAPIKYRMIAEGDQFADGEEGVLPIVSNKLMVTNTRAFTLQAGETIDYSLADLMASGTPLQLTFDYTAHPIWTVIQALPSLADYPHACTEQMLNKYFAHALGHQILTSIPQMEEIIAAWKAEGSQALLANLQKNEELKSTTLENTPWVRQAAHESDQKAALAQFLDKNQLGYQQDQLLEKVLNNQNSNGGFPWFNGGRSNTYITQYIMENLARMQALGVLSLTDGRLSKVVNNALLYIDEEMEDRYKSLEVLAQEGKIDLEDDHVRALDIHYLFTRSYFQHEVSQQASKAYNYYHEQAKKYWVAKSDYMRSLIARYLHRKGEPSIPASILQSFSERMQSHPDLGAYWKHSNGYHWYQNPIESHVYILELYQEIDSDNELIRDMQLWLLNHKRTNAWPTTKSTALAIHALLRSKSGSLIEWTSAGEKPIILIDGTAMDLAEEAATGYVKKVFSGDQINSVEEISMTNNNNNVSWGGIYFSYLADMDEVKSDGGADIDVQKSLFLKTIRDGEEVLVPAGDQQIKVGDEIVSRIEIRTDRDMSFLHLKDMRGSGLEPINVLSGYRWKSGMGYYESTKDVASHFFIDYLRKGTYVFEYSLRVSHAGDFSNGITTLQSMYAPEFASNSQSSQLRVSD